MRVLVIGNCSSRKRASLGRPVRMQDVPQGTAAFVADMWTDVLCQKKERVQGSELYCGRGFGEILTTAKLLNADLLIVSAGLGLVDAQTPVPLYSATISGDSQDNVLKRVRGGDANSWWDVLNQTSPFAKPLQTEPYDLILVALSAPYFKMFRPTLEQLCTAERQKVRLFVSSSAVELPVSLRRFRMPYDGRFDHKESPVPGTKSDFVQRAMRHFATVLVRCSLESAGPESHHDQIEHELRTLTVPTTPVRTKLSDVEITVLMKHHWFDANGKSTKMLRLLRDSLGVACEQKRFQQLFHKIKFGGTAEVNA